MPNETFSEANRVPRMPPEHDAEFRVDIAERGVRFAISSLDKCVINRDAEFHEKLLLQLATRVSRTDKRRGPRQTMNEA